MFEHEMLRVGDLDDDGRRTGHKADWMDFAGSPYPPLRNRS